MKINYKSFTCKRLTLLLTRGKGYAQTIKVWNKPISQWKDIQPH